MIEISDDALLPSDVDPKEEEAEKSHFLITFEFRFYFFNVVSYNPQVQSTNLRVCDLGIENVIF